MRRAIATAFGLATLYAAAPASATTITYNNFSDLSAFQQNGSTAAIADPTVDSLGRNVLRLTNALSQGGSAFLTNAISLANKASFSTAFQFRITDPAGISDGDGQGADGIVFVVQTVSNTAGGIGGGIGYTGIQNSLGVEFDTYDNGGGLNDPNGNHVGIDIGGSFNGPTSIIPTRMNNGSDWYAWVDYDGNAQTVEVRVSTTNSRPSAATVTRSVDLVNVLGQTDAFIGFTSGTGAASGFHDIVSWTFIDDFKPIDDGGDVPEPAGLALLGGLALAGIATRRKSAK